MKTAMTSERIKEIQATTGYPDSVSVKQALLQVWNECEQSPASAAISAQYSSGAIHNIGEFPATAPMSEEQVEEWYRGYMKEKGSTINILDMLKAFAATAPPANDGWVNIYEDIQGRYIGDSEYSSYQEAFDERDELYTYLETVQINRLPAPPQQ